MNVLEYALLGMGVGAAYALIGQGIVLVYLGSGTVSFAHGALAMFGAYLFYEAFGNWPRLAAFAGALLIVGAIGALFSQVVMRPLRTKSGLARMVANLGLLTFLTGLATYLWGGDTRLVSSPLPDSTITLGSLAVAQSRLWLVAIAIVSAGLLWYVFRYARVGLATKAMAENEIACATFGWSPDFLSGVNWALGSMLAAAAGILIAPQTGLNTSVLTLIVIEALAVALIGSFRSFPVAVVAGLGLGIVQAEAGFYVNIQGFADATALVAIVAVLVLRGQTVPVRGHILDRLPALGSGRINWPAVVIAVAGVVALAWSVLPLSYVAGLSTTTAFALILLSVVVVTGFTGQLSLAQFSLAGVGALVAGRLAMDQHWPFAVVALVGIAASTVVGLVFALPALRTRGVNLAVVTLALALALQQVVFHNPQYIGGESTDVGPQRFLGINIDPVFQARRYALLTLIIFVAVALLVARLRRSRTGQRLIAVRGNERAAAALGINVVNAKLIAFGLAAAIAGLGGILLAFTQYSILYAQFDPLQSIYAVVYAVLGGIGFVTGPLIGGGFAPGGVGTTISNNLLNFTFLAEHGTAIIGVVVTLQILQSPDGAASHMAKSWRWLCRRVRQSSQWPLTGPPMPEAPETRSARTESPFGAHTVRRRVRDAALEVTDISVRFGGVIAVNGVSLSVRTGEIVALIGPNGAGKTALLDAISGFNSVAGGRITLDGRRIDRLPPYRRARAGLGRSFQALELFEDVTVRENIEVASARATTGSSSGGSLRRRRSVLSAEAVEAIYLFELSGSLERLPNGMSNGERHMAAMARAVAPRPAIVLLDEPVAGLDDGERRRLASVVQTLAKRYGIGVLLVEHDIAFVMEICDRIVVLDFGQCIAAGTVDEIRTDAKVIAAYLGQNESGSDPEFDAPQPPTGAVGEKVAPDRR